MKYEKRHPLQKLVNPPMYHTGLGVFVTNITPFSYSKSQGLQSATAAIRFQISRDDSIWLWEFSLHALGHNLHKGRAFILTTLQEGIQSTRKYTRLHRVGVPKMIWSPNQYVMHFQYLQINQFDLKKGNVICSRKEPCHI